MVRQTKIHFSGVFSKRQRHFQPFLRCSFSLLLLACAVPGFAQATAEAQAFKQQRGTLAATRSHDFSTRLALAKFLHFEGVDGNTEAAERAREMFTRLASEQPHDPLVLVYLGSAYLLAAQHTAALWKKGVLSKEGLVLLDRAVSLAPDDLEVRFVRGVSTYHLPFFFRRAGEAEEDFMWVTARALPAIETGRLDPKIASAAFFFDGECRAQRGDELGARASWRTAIAIAPKSRAGRDAVQRLRGGRN